MISTGTKKQALSFTPEEVAEFFDQLSVEDITELYMNMSRSEQNTFESLLKTSPPRALMPHQIVPIEETWWEVFLLLGGRGVGKTVTGATAVRDHLRALGPNARVGIGAPTIADARDTCMEGQTGLITMFPNEFTDYKRSLGEAHHINGGFVKAMGTEKPKRWNGPQWSVIWFDELALCNQAAWDDANLGLRLGTRPYAICTSTPKNRQWVKKLAMDKTTIVPKYMGEDGNERLPTTFDNKFLPERRVQFLKNKYGNSRLGRQELEGVFVDDVDGAKWKREYITHLDDMDKLPPFLRVVVSIDPAGSPARSVADVNALTEEQRQNQTKNAETAICVSALGLDGRFYIVAIESDRWGPTEWGEKALYYYHKYRADKLVVETNFGGGMVENVIRNIKVFNQELNRELNGRYVPITTVVASRGKHIRAEPVVTLYEQGRVVHTLYFGEAEDQMCAFVDADENEGADMVDAIVWGVLDLAGMGQDGNSLIVTPADPRFSQIHIVR